MAAVAGANALCVELPAQESGRSRIGSGAVADDSRPELESAELRAAVRRADLLTRRQNIPTALSQDSGNETTSEAVVEYEPAPRYAGSTGSYSRHKTWKQSFGERLRSVLGKPARSVYESDDDAGLDLGWNLEEHLLPEEVDPDVDVYDSKPILVELGPAEAIDTGVQDPPESDQDVVPRSQSILRLNRDISAIEPTLDYATRGIAVRRLPPDFYEKMDNGVYEPHKFNPVVFQWAPTNLYHHPLYFEDPGLERYGHTYSPLVQPFASTGKFATQLVTLPYQMTLNPVHSRDYTLGWYRPGDVAPKKTYVLPFNEEATVMQAATVAALFLIIP